jgi:hypothetical protein
MLVMDIIFAVLGGLFIGGAMTFISMICFVASDTERAITKSLILGGFVTALIITGIIATAVTGGNVFC